MEISSRTITIFLVVAIIISLFGTFISITKITGWGPSVTGFASDTGTGIVNLTVNAVTDINWSVSNLSWGEGSLASGAVNCSLNTNASGNDGTCSGFSDLTNYPLAIENIGNQNVSLNLSFNNNATTFIGGTSPAYYFMANESEVNSCFNTTGGTDADAANHYSTSIYYLGSGDAVNNNMPDDWVSVNETTVEDYIICPLLKYDDADDSVNVYVYITVPMDAGSGNLSSTITATAYTLDNG